MMRQMPKALTFRVRHEVRDLAARDQVVLHQRRREVRRPPPTLELAWVRPEFPHPLDRCVEADDHADRQVLVIGVDG